MFNSTWEFSPKQFEYIREANRLWNGKVGATRCGKTWLDITDTIARHIRERVGKKGLSFILGVSKGTIERNILSPMRDIYGPKLVGEINSENTAMIFGELVHCLGTEKKSQVAKFRGAEAKYIYWDEICESNEEVFELMKSRLSLEYSRCDFTANPKDPNHFVKKFIDNPKLDVYVQNWTIFDNPFLPPRFVNELCNQYEGTVYYDRYILGMWKRAEGSIYKVFADNPEAYIINEYPQDLDLRSIRVGVDFGGNQSAHAFVAVGYTRGCRQVIVLDEELIEHAEITAQELENKYVEFANRVYNRIGNAFMTYYDNAESVLGKTFQVAASKRNLHTIVKKAKKITITDRIRLTLNLMGNNRLKIMKGCNHLIKSFQDAVWDDKKTEDVRLDNNTYCVDILDAFEYCIERDINILLQTS